jgi:hypothetical protein
MRPPGCGGGREVVTRPAAGRRMVLSRAAGSSSLAVERREDMKDQWYADARDLVKWGVLLHLAEHFAAQEIIQVAYLRPTQWPELNIAGEPAPIPKPVLEHFRDIGRISQLQARTKIRVVDLPFTDRQRYQRHLLEVLASREQGRVVLFLDPDTGLEPAGPSGLQHVLASELRELWLNLRSGDALVFYQHQTNRSGMPWVAEKQKQFSAALGVPLERVGVASGPAIARDVVFFYSEK